MYEKSNKKGPRARPDQSLGRTSSTYSMTHKFHVLASSLGQAYLPGGKKERPQLLALQVVGPPEVIYHTMKIMPPVKK